MNTPGQNLEIKNYRAEAMEYTQRLLDDTTSTLLAMGAPVELIEQCTQAVMAVAPTGEEVSASGLMAFRAAATDAIRTILDATEQFPFRNFKRHSEAHNRIDAKPETLVIVDEAILAEAMAACLDVRLQLSFEAHDPVEVAQIKLAHGLDTMARIIKQAPTVMPGPMEVCKGLLEEAALTLTMLNEVPDQALANLQTILLSLDTDDLRVDNVGASFEVNFLQPLIGKIKGCRVLLEAAELAPPINNIEAIEQWIAAQDPSTQGHILELLRKGQCPHWTTLVSRLLPTVNIPHNQSQDRVQVLDPHDSRRKAGPQAEETTGQIHDITSILTNRWHQTASTKGEGAEIDDDPMASVDFEAPVVDLSAHFQQQTRRNDVEAKENQPNQAWFNAVVENYTQTLVLLGATSQQVTDFSAAAQDVLPSDLITNSALRDEATTMAHQQLRLLCSHFTIELTGLEPGDFDRARQLINSASYREFCQMAHHHQIDPQQTPLAYRQYTARLAALVKTPAHHTLNYLVPVLMLEDRRLNANIHKALMEAELLTVEAPLNALQVEKLETTLQNNGLMLDQAEEQLVALMHQQYKAIQEASAA